MISLLGSTEKTLPGAQPSTKTLVLKLQLKTDLFLITFFAFCVDKMTELAPYSEENVCVCVKCTNTLFWAWQRKSLCSPSSAVHSSHSLVGEVRNGFQGDRSFCYRIPVGRKNETSRMTWKQNSCAPAPSSACETRTLSTAKYLLCILHQIPYKVFAAAGFSSTFLSKFVLKVKGDRLLS